MARIVVAEPLTAAAFAPFGEVIEAGGANHYPINGGKADRFHALARPEATGPGGHVLISVVRGAPYAFPLALDMVERHPLGSQAFVPMAGQPFVVVVCPDGPDGRPGEPRAFLSAPGQGVNYPRGRWHGVLTAVGSSQDFLVVDRGGAGVNLEEHYFDGPYEVRLPEPAE